MTATVDLIIQTEKAIEKELKGLPFELQALSEDDFYYQMKGSEATSFVPDFSETAAMYLIEYDESLITEEISEKDFSDKIQRIARLLIDRNTDEDPYTEQKMEIMLYFWMFAHMIDKVIRLTSDAEINNARQAEDLLLKKGVQVLKKSDGSLLIVIK